MQINNQCTTEAARYIVSRNEVIDSEPWKIAREPPPSHRLGRMDAAENYAVERMRQITQNLDSRKEWRNMQSNNR